MELIQENVSALAGKFGVQPEVITKFLTDASASEEVKPFATLLPSLEVYKPDELSTRIANERKLAAEEAERNTKGMTYGAVDRRVKEKTGIEKQAGESTLDYQERAFREAFSKTTDSEDTQRLRDDLKATKQLLETKQAEFDTYKQTVEKQTAKQRITGVEQSAAAKLQLADAGQTDYLLYRFGQKYAAQLNGDAVEYKDRATGEVVRNPRTAAPATAEELLTLFAPSVVSLKQETSAKTGSGFDSSRADLNKGDAATMDFSGMATVEDFHKELRKQGIAAGSTRGGDLYAAFKKARPELFK